MSSRIHSSSSSQPSPHQLAARHVSATAVLFAAGFRLL